jgi:hypothetical protein
LIPLSSILFGDRNRSKRDFVRGRAGVGTCGDHHDDDDDADDDDDDGDSSFVVRGEEHNRCYSSHRLFGIFPQLRKERKKTKQKQRYIIVGLAVQ